MMRSGYWRGVVLILTIAATAALGSIASAAPGSRICRAIEAQLAGGSSAAAGKYGAAIQRQQGEIAKVRGQMRAVGCGFFASDRSCSSLSRKLRSMERNLGSLRSTQSRMRGGASGRSRTQLIAALDANNCRGNRPAVSASRSPGIFERLLGPPAVRSRGPELAYAPAPTIRRNGRNADRVVSGGASPFRGDPNTFRTFCVRSCDGYYFPMSPASSRSDFERDENNCQAACPGATMDVYYHKDGEEEAGTMISVRSGALYEDLSKAFAYREAAATPQCSCGTRLRTNPALQAQRDEKALPPLPRARPDRAADPETLANADGGLDLAAMRRLMSSTRVSSGPARKVRVVGPVFLPDPPAAASPQVPGPTAVQ